MTDSIKSNYLQNGYKIVGFDITSTGDITLNYSANSSGNNTNEIQPKLNFSGFNGGKTIVTVDGGLDIDDINEIGFKVQDWNNHSISAIDVKLEKITKGEQISIAGSGDKFKINDNTITLENSIQGRKLVFIKTNTAGEQLDKNNTYDIENLAISLTEYKADKTANGFENLVESRHIPNPTGADTAHREWAVGTDLKNSIESDYYIYKIEETGTPLCGSAV